MKKIKKFMKSPGVFARDYFNKRYPAVNNEQGIKEPDEGTLIAHTLNIAAIESELDIPHQPVDAVFTWVDNSDAEWQKKYQAHVNAESTTRYALYSQDSARFENHNELYYSLHSVEKNLPWVRSIYIVTDGQIPAWFDQAEHPKVVFIDHEQIIDSQYLPTFNSHVIEAHLHKIPGLSEQFIYLNDDIFIARPLPRERFFHPNGVASIFVSDKKISVMAEKGVETPTLKASLKGIALLKEKYGSVSIDRPLVHTYVPLLKTSFEKAWEWYRHEITHFLSNKFRADTDLNMATFLVPWMMYLEGKSVPAWEICYYFNIRSANAPMQYRKLLQKKETASAPHSICANDFNSEKSISGYQSRLINTLKQYYGI